MLVCKYIDGCVRGIVERERAEDGTALREYGEGSNHGNIDSDGNGLSTAQGPVAVAMVPVRKDISKISITSHLLFLGVNYFLIGWVFGHSCDMIWG